MTIVTLVMIPGTRDMIPGTRDMIVMTLGMTSVTTRNSILTIDIIIIIDFGANIAPKNRTLFLVEPMQ